ncbi:hypothetical protein PanWU01x14_127060 [Parasponia andersonii]|uniref:Transmembrane protein n=1 Tax=Parasponia andersonii TaxID=3476 RepID=A0A2P5CT10_PARAD|nr:hypothetical protein PanWU01x14_127060 [Parasponia andersonii]
MKSIIIFTTKPGNNSFDQFVFRIYKILVQLVASRNTKRRRTRRKSVLFLLNIWFHHYRKIVFIFILFYFLLLFCCAFLACASRSRLWPCITVCISHN